MHIPFQLSRLPSGAVKYSHRSSKTIDMQLLKGYESAHNHDRESCYEFFMKVSLPVLRGTMGGRQYYSLLMSLSEIPHLFKFNDWDQCTPELRAQRVLNKARVPDITEYILENEDGYLFSSITASYSCPVKFTPSTESTEFGTLEMELENVEFIINDGQHRCAAIAAAVKENPALGKEKISVLLFETESLERLQQMFSDLNRFVQQTSKSLGMLYDRRDNLSALTMEVSEQVDVFRGTVDKEKVTIPLRSPKLFTISALYEANEELLGKKVAEQGSAVYAEILKRAVEYWTEVSRIIDDWQKVKHGELSASELRQEKINTHAVVLRALGGVGRTLLEKYPHDWQKKLKLLEGIDWRKSVGTSANPLWDDVCITAGSVVSNRQARAATLAVLLREIGESPNGKVIHKESAEVTSAQASE
jgi:DNA sulfur modification protein DndB